MLLNLYTTSGLSILLHDVISPPDVTSCEKNIYNFFAFKVMLPAFLLSADFFYNQLLRKILSGIPSECQTAWIQIGYQQTTLADRE